MTPRERLYTRMEGKPVDKIPNLNLVMGMVAKAAGVSYREYVQDYRKLVEGQLICAERFGFDTVGVISDPMREASAYGTEVIFPENSVPHYSAPLLKNGFDLSKVQIFDPLNSPRTLDRIKGVELLRQKVLSDYPVIGWAECVLATVANLRGVNSLMSDLTDEDCEEPLRELMEVLFKQQCRFAKEQINAGADIIGLGNAVASLIGPGLYEEYAFDYDKALIDYVHDNGAKVKLHICGNIKALLPFLKELEPDIIDIDWMVDLKEASDVFKGTKTCVSGNVDPVAVLLMGDAALVEEKVRECISIDDNSLLAAAGCEIPAATPEENLLLMDRLLYI